MKKSVPLMSLFLALALSSQAGLQITYAKENTKAKPNPQASGQSNGSSSSNNSNSGGNSGGSSSSSNNSNSGGNSGGSSSSSNNSDGKVSGSSNQPAKVTETAKPSSNKKLNPSSLPKDGVNGRAAKASKVYSRTAEDCRTATNAGKAKVEADPCSDFIVVFQPGLARGTSDELIKGNGAQVKRHFSAVFNGALVNGPLSKMQALANNPNVLVVEDDLEVKSTGIQTSAPWGLDRIDQSSLPLSTTFNDADMSGANSYAFIVDTGIDANNVDFAGRVAPGFSAIADGRGSLDCNGHGTHVAGIVGGTQYGVAKKSTLVPVRVLDCNGSGSYSSVISGLDWIAANYRSGDAAVVNMSLGGPISSTLDGAVKNLITKGISVVVAAGNSAADACSYSPARVSEAITVGATEVDDNRASFSNFGSCLDIFAPGSGITSTWIGSAGSNTISGTSMAAPHVAGAIARFLSNNLGLTPAQVANSVKGSATKGVVLNPGVNSLNQLLFSEIKADTTTITPVDPSPTFRKVNPRGKK